MSAEYYLQGRQGGVVLEASSSIGQGDGPFRWIQLIQDTVFEDLTDIAIEDIFQITGRVIPAGIGIGGNFTNVTLTSGMVIAYKV